MIENVISNAVATSTTTTSCRRSWPSTATNTAASSSHVTTDTTVCAQRSKCASAYSADGIQIAMIAM